MIATLIVATHLSAHAERNLESSMSSNAETPPKLLEIYSESPGVQRIAFIDIAKGIAISLVVFGHVLGGTLARGWVVPANCGELVYKFIYTFHMPVFFIISGAFTIGHIRRDPFHAFVSRCGSIAWPYLLWGTIFVILQTSIARFMLFPPSETGAVDSMERLLLGQTSWFLWTLFVCEVLLISAVVIPVGAVFVVSLIMSLALSGSDLGIFGNVVHFMPYLALGALIGRRLKDVKMPPPALSLLVGLLIFTGLFGAVANGLDNSIGVEFLEGTFGSIALLLLAYGLNALTGSAVAALRTIGEASLVIFLLHPYFQSVARVALEHISGPGLPLQLIVPTLVGILGPALVWIVADRAGLQWLFRLTVRKTQGAAAQLKADEIRR
jgi:fucose 4-O-acetylase-like acetyltransferase